MNDEGEVTGHLDRHDVPGPERPARAGGTVPDGPIPARPALDQIEAALDDVSTTLAQMG